MSKLYDEIDTGRHWMVGVGCFVVAGILILVVLMLQGCAVFIVTGPGSVYSHEQGRGATNVVVNETVPISAKLADTLLKATGIEASGNTAKIGSDNKASLK